MTFIVSYTWIDFVLTVVVGLSGLCFKGNVSALLSETNN